ncbi:MAG TPA: ABC transporter ATP-binding protein [Candidatus Thermoplasmatota archaeon]|nr:ABC transporter ATP-binding protein [Candidatus Thermoplasmatota archaeon]
MPSDILVAKDVRRHFGGLRAVDGMDIAVEQGTLTGIIGPNGAGKTTFFNVLAGFLPPTSGTIHFDGKDVTKLPAHKRCQLGLARTFQITRPFQRMSVLENVMVAAQGQAGERVWGPLLAGPRVTAQEDTVRARAEEHLRFLGLDHLTHEYAGALSGGQKKLLEIARALMTEPKLILLDEPMAGVNPTLARKIMEKIQVLRVERGITFLLIEHDLETVFRHCDPIIVMAQGKELARGGAADIRANRAVIEAYLGG